MPDQDESASGIPLETKGSCDRLEKCEQWSVLLSFPATACTCRLENCQTGPASSSYLTSYGTLDTEKPLSLSMLHWFSPALPRTLSLTLLVAVVSAQCNLSTTKSSSNISLECSTDQERLPSRRSWQMKSPSTKLRCQCHVTHIVTCCCTEGCC